MEEIKGLGLNQEQIDFLKKELQKLNKSNNEMFAEYKIVDIYNLLSSNKELFKGCVVIPHTLDGGVFSRTTIYIQKVI